MQFDLPNLLKMAKRSAEDPRGVASEILALNLPLGPSALALLVVALLTAVSSALVGQIAMQAGDTGGLANLTPLQWALLQTAGMFISAAAIAVIGRWFGGTGDLAGAMALLAWAEFVILIVQIVQTIALLIAPPAVLLLAFFGLALTFWLLVNFIAQLHGFSSLIKVFAGLIVAGIGLFFLLTVAIATVLGISGA